jgi:Tfp pilus assembly protein PilO
VTARDRTVVTVIAALVLVAAAWFLLLAPVRKDAKALDEQITTAQSRLTAAQAVVTQGNAAKTAYRDDYAAVSRLGKAVPADDDVPSLVVQLESAADRSRVDFRSIELTTGGAATAAPAAAPAPTGATGTTGPAAPAGAVAPAGSVPATQAAASALPPGAVVGPAGFPTMPFDFAFTGSFFKLQDFLARLDRFTQVEGEDITVRGRLLTVDGFSLSASAKGFPSMLASVHATAYLLPSEESADAGSASLSTPAAPPVATTPPGAAGAPASPAPVTGAGPR